jgi:hypothetical protein
MKILPVGAYLFHVDGRMDRHDEACTHTHTHTHTHRVKKSIVTQNFMNYASDLMVALVDKGTILILMVKIKNSGGVVVSSGLISYKISHTNKAISLPFPIKKGK